MENLAKRLGKLFNVCCSSSFLNPNRLGSHALIFCELSKASTIQIIYGLNGTFRSFMACIGTNTNKTGDFLINIWPLLKLINWKILGPNWGQIGAKLGPNWGQIGAKADMSNLTKQLGLLQLVHFLALFYWIWTSWALTHWFSVHWAKSRIPIFKYEIRI